MINPDAAADLKSTEFQFMTSAEINTYIQDVVQLPNPTAGAYTLAESIFEALGGGPLTPDAEGDCAAISINHTLRWV